MAADGRQQVNVHKAKSQKIRQHETQTGTLYAKVANRLVLTGKHETKQMFSPPYGRKVISNEKQLTILRVVQISDYIEGPITLLTIAESFFNQYKIYAAMLAHN